MMLINCTQTALVRAMERRLVTARSATIRANSHNTRSRRNTRQALRHDTPSRQRSIARPTIIIANEAMKTSENLGTSAMARFPKTG
jgi:hypothetical protein